LIKERGIDWKPMITTKQKKYLAFLSGGNFEVICPFHKYYDAASFSEMTYFEYERHKNRFRNAAEKLLERILKNPKKQGNTPLKYIKNGTKREVNQNPLEIIKKEAMGILVVQDHEK